MLNCMIEGTSRDSIAAKIDARADLSRYDVPAESQEQAAMKMLVDGCRHLDELNRFLLQTSELYRGGDNRKGLECFMQLIDGMEWFAKTAITAEQVLKLDFAGTSCGGRTLTESVETLNGILLEIIAAQEQRDWVLLTDLLEYELAPELKLWLDIFTTLRYGNEYISGDTLCS